LGIIADLIGINRSLLENILEEQRTSRFDQPAKVSIGKNK
jgi:hypothetical protein